MPCLSRVHTWTCPASLMCTYLDMPCLSCVHALPLMCTLLTMPCLSHVYMHGHALPLSCAHAWTCPASLMCVLLDMLSLFHMLFIVKYIEETGWWLCCVWMVSQWAGSSFKEQPSTGVNTSSALMPFPRFRSPHWVCRLLL